MIKICKLNGCDKPTIHRNTICGMHRSRKQRHGDYSISPNWNVLKKGQPLLTPLGYLRINIDGKRMLHHRYVMELHLGRKLLASEKVHHINHVKTDNRIDNLEIMSQSEHIAKRHPKQPIIDWSQYSVPKNNNNGVCLVENCDIKTRSKGLCSKHFQSFYKNDR